MNRLFITLGACLLVLAGCLPTTKTVFPHHYALGDASAAVASDQTPASTKQGVLQIARIDVPPWLAGTGMYYRLDYRNDHRLSAYTQSDWVAPPATLLEPMLQGAIAAGGGWRAVVGPRSPARADATVHIRLEDFSQVFAQADRSTGVIEATATLVDNDDHHVIAQKRFRIAVPAATPDAKGGAQALADASRQLARQLTHWLLTAAPDAPPSHDALAGLPNVSFPTPHRVASGMLRPGDIAALQKAATGI